MIYINTARIIANRLLEEIPNESLDDVISYLVFIKNKKNNLIFKELEEASLSSISFWDNQIDDEVWNNV